MSVTKKGRYFTKIPHFGNTAKKKINNTKPRNFYVYHCMKLKMKQN